MVHESSWSIQVWHTWHTWHTWACNGLVMGRREHTQANYYNFSTSMIDCTAGLTVPRKNAELPKLTPVFKHGGTKLKR